MNLEVPEAPLFHPTLSEFQDFYTYLDQIRPQVESQFGICRIAPPKEWWSLRHPVKSVLRRLSEKNFLFKTKIQRVHQLQLRNNGPNERFMSLLSRFWKDRRGFSSHHNLEDDLPLTITDSAIELDLPRFYFAVMARGGFNLVREQNRWNEIAQALRLNPNGDSNTVAVDLEQYYSRYLLDFQENGPLQTAHTVALLEQLLRKPILPVRRDDISDERPKKRARRKKKACHTSRMNTGDSSQEDSDDDDDDEETEFGYLTGDEFGVDSFRDMANDFKQRWFQDALVRWPIPSKSKETPGMTWTHISPAKYRKLSKSVPSKQRDSNLADHPASKSRAARKLFTDDEPTATSSMMLPQLALGVNPISSTFTNSTNLIASPPRRAVRRLARRGGTKRLDGISYYEQNNVSPQDVIAEFWRIVEHGDENVRVHYGSDVDVQTHTSGFPVPHEEVFPKITRTIANFHTDLLSAPTKNATATLASDTPSTPSTSRSRKRNQPQQSVRKSTRKIGLNMRRSNKSLALEESSWNLNVLPQGAGSVLSTVRWSIPGVTSPMMYVGMLFSSFCWHTEDNYMPSINYLHFGDPKIWYGIPASAADQFEQVMREAIPDLFEKSPDLFHRLVTMVPPALLLQRGVPVYHTVHEQGQFVVTFPRAYHAGFNTGFNIAEAVNFAPPSWLPYGRQAVENYRTLTPHHVAVFSHDELVINAALNVADLHMASRLKEELDWIIKEENRLREQLVALNIKVFSMPAPQQNEGPHHRRLKKGTNFETEQHLCEVCRYECFLSYVRCSCSSDKYVCLRHADQLCKCPDSKKAAFVRFSDQALQQLFDHVAEFERLALQAEAISPSTRVLHSEIDSEENEE